MGGVLVHFFFFSMDKKRRKRTKKEKNPTADAEWKSHESHLCQGFLGFHLDDTTKN